MLAKRLPFLTQFTISSLLSLRHSNHSCIVEIHSPTIGTDGTYDPSRYGAIIALSVLTRSGCTISCRLVERMASEKGIHVRAGCMCNPGATAHLLGAKTMTEELWKHLEKETGEQSVRLASSVSHLDPALVGQIREFGVVRVSFGLASSLDDAGAFVDFVRSTFCDFEVDDREAPGRMRSASLCDPCVTAAMNSSEKQEAATSYASTATGTQKAGIEPIGETSDALEVRQGSSLPGAVRRYFCF